jgi:hypothetical protein
MANYSTARARLNGHEEGFAGIALCAFKAAQLETRFVRLDAGQPHRFAAPGAIQNSVFRNAKKWIGGVDSMILPLDQAGARHSQSPIVARCRTVIEPTYALGSMHAGQYCSLSKNKDCSGQDNWEDPRSGWLAKTRAALKPPFWLLAVCSANSFNLR